MEHIKQGLASFYPRSKDRRALVASSSAIALSIASPPSDPTDPTLDEPGSSKDLGWRTAYQAAKLAVDIANASSDMFLPLKAVVGALSVLLQNYDVSTSHGLSKSSTHRFFKFLQQHIANAEQFKEVNKRVQSLSQVLTSPVDDQDIDEKARRETLRRFVFSLEADTGTPSNRLLVHRALVGVIAKLNPLSEQHGIAKFLKNADHANTLNGFVQDLAYAVTDYQVWATNPIPRAF